MPNTDWDRLGDGQLEHYADYLLKAEFASHGFEILPSAPDRFTVAAGSRRLEVAWKATRGFKPVAFSKSGTSAALLVVFLEGKPPMLYMVPAEAWQTKDALLKTKRDQLVLDIGKSNMNLLANYGFDFAVRRVLR